MEKPNLHSQRSRWHLPLRALLFLLMIGYGLSVRASDSKVSINANGIALENVLKSIEQQTKYRFIYSKETINVSVPVTLSVKDEALTTVLDQLLTKHDIVYTFDKKQIVLNKKSDSQSHPSKQQVSKGNIIKIVGTVTDTQGEPLIGASVIAEGGSTGVSTDIEGHYELEVPQGSRLSFSYVGFSPERKRADKAGVLDVTLSEDSQLLNEVVVMGYGSTTRKNLTTSIATVKTEDLQKAAVSNVNSLLLGRAAGVQASISSPQPGGGINISVRGGGNPVYVIDGVVMPNQPLEGSTGNTNLPNSVNRSNLQGLNPSDIESIEILKDASAAIYGIGAADGVILITTKKGKEGKPRVVYEGSYSWQKHYKYTEMLNGPDLMRMVNIFSKENYLYDRAQYPYGNSAYDGKWSPYFTDEQIANAINHDWLADEFKPGYITNHNVSVSGGSQFIKYYLGLNYYKEDATVRNSDMERFALRTNVQVKLTNFLRFTTIANINQNNYNNSTNGGDNGNLNRQGGGAIFCAQSYPSYLPTYDANGSFTQFVNVPNPVALRSIRDYTKNSSWYVNFALDADIVKNMLTFRGVYGANNETGERDAYIPSDVYFGLQRKSRGNIVTNKRLDTTLEGFFNFNHTFGPVDVSAMVGMGRYITSWNGLNLSYENANDLISSDNVEKADGPFYPSSNRAKNEKRSQFARASVDLFNKYVISGSVRRDGTDKFFPGKKYSWFPSVSMAWKIKNESFMRDIVWINMLKLRASYGETGSDNLGTTLYGVINTTREDVQFAGNTVTYTPYILVGANYDDVSWQKTTMKNIGLDFSVLHDRLSGSIDFFRNDVTRLLGSTPTELLGMHGTRPINGGHYRRSGIDISLNSTNIDKKDFTWTTMLTLSHYKAVWVERMPNYDYQVFQIRKNEPMNSVYYYKTTGIINADRSNLTEVQRTLGASACLPGFPLVEDSNGDGKIDLADVNTYDVTPKLYYGFGNTFRYKDFDLDIYMYGQLGVKKWNTAYELSVKGESLPRGLDYNNVGKYVFQVWNSQTNSGDGAKFPGLAASKMTMPGNIGFDTTLKDASFLRIRNITLGYNVPGKWLTNIFHEYVSGVRVYVDFQNPFTFTRYKGTDPEIATTAGTLAGGQFPQTRSYTVGIKLSF